MKWTRQRTLISGLVLLGLANAVALGGVAYNRSGEPDSTLRLTERELRPPYVWTGWKENSGLALRLQWRVLPGATPDAGAYRFPVDGGGSPAWLDESKMASLGFDVNPSTVRQGADRNSAYQRQLARDVLVVLELDGPAYRMALERAASAARALESMNSHGDGKKDADEVMDRQSRRSSRLFAVDAGLDLAALRSTYRDRDRYAIVRGQVRPAWSPEGKGSAGIVTEVSAAMVYVPLEMHSAFEGVAPSITLGPEGKSKPFVARVAFGQRLEPWLVSAAAP